MKNVQDSIRAKFARFREWMREYVIPMAGACIIAGLPAGGAIIYRHFESPKVHLVFRSAEGYELMDSMKLCNSKSRGRLRYAVECDKRDYQPTRHDRCCHCGKLYREHIPYSMVEEKEGFKFKIPDFTPD